MAAQAFTPEENRMGRVGLIEDSQSEKTANIKEILYKGLDFNGPNKWDILEIIPNLDKLCNNLPEADSSIMKMKLSNRIKKYVTKEGKKSIIKDKNYFQYINQIKALHNFLQENKIEIIKADKSKQIVIATQEWVKNKKQEITNNTKFRKLPINPIEVIYLELKRRITKLEQLHEINKTEKWFILNEGNERTPKLNIQLKTHKIGEKVRPIVDFKYSMLYNLEKFLKQQLKQYQNSQFAIKNTDELIEELNQISIEEDSRIASLDVVDMYPSITWDLIEDKLKNLEVNNEIINLIEFTYRSNYFEFDGDYYTQTDGISMGSVIGPKLAELIMIDVDNKISSIRGVKFYKRYVDDILLIYNKAEIAIEGIKKQINNIHEAIKFKVEVEEETSQEINYLDITIKRLKQSLEFRTFKKPSSGNITIRYQSNIPLHIKYNTFKMEYSKIKHRTSQKIYIHKDIAELKKKFLLAGYPQRLLNKWEIKLNTPKIPHNNEQANNMKYTAFPYIKGLYEEINKEIKILDFKLAPSYQKLSNRLKHLNPLKKQQAITETKNVVYKIPCTCNNNKHYIGETKRKLGVRLKEHIADLKYHRINSVFHDHCTLNGCKIDKDNVEILHKEIETYKVYQVYNVY
ncbi:putative autophagy-related protein 11 [Centruroides vittatus]|uniref:putative autophagy-related protein 11 n=1 Tax=Centruroides vittatus TaxID=120091 RepID=UPI00350FCE7F